MKGPKRVLIGRWRAFAKGKVQLPRPLAYKQTDAKKGRIDTGTHESTRVGAETAANSAARPGRADRSNARVPPSSQRLARTITRIPARTAGGRLDHASTTAARSRSAGAGVGTFVCNSAESLPFPSETGSATGLQIRHRGFDSGRSLCF